MTRQPADGFQGRFERLPAGGWRVVVPVHAESVACGKRTVVYEEVDIRREMVEEVATPTRPVRHEELDVGGD